MLRAAATLILVVGSLAGCKKSQSPEDQCEAIYKKGDGEKPYATDKTKFMDACKKTEDNTRRCLLLSGEESFKDKTCGPGNGNTFRESMEIMKLGQGS
jgi:hypothetical protein